MKTVYVFPYLDEKLVFSPNPYIKNLISSFSDSFIFINKGYCKSGILDLVRHFFSADIFILNWPENVVYRKFGLFQGALLSILLVILRLIPGKKVVWILHNGRAHDKPHNLSFQWIFKILARFSDIIITHASKGVSIIKGISNRLAGKVYYLPHPIEPLFPAYHQIKKEYDFLIWGSILPYKGVLEVVRYLMINNQQKQIRLLIIGKCFSEEYKKGLMALVSDNCEWIDEQISIDEIFQYAQKCSYILFGYKNDSVLSSGALMDSIRMRAKIIAPAYGAFADLSGHCFVQTYSGYPEIISILNSKELNADVCNSEVVKFYEYSNWASFGKRLATIISTCN